MTEYDIFLVACAVFAVFGVVSVFGATVDGRSPRVGVIMLVISGGALYFASQERAEGIEFVDIPNAFIRLAGAFF